jgi:hypothetical protein
MGRPLHKKYFGNRNIGSASTTADDGIGGQGIASITLGAANNSAGYTAGASQIALGTPDVVTGVQATASLVVGPAGAFLTTAASTSGTNRTTFTATGTGTAATGTFTGLVQKAGGTTTGSGATFTIVKATTGTNYATGGVLTTITASSKGTGYAVGDTIVIDGALIGGVTTTNDITLTVVGAVAGAGTITGITITEQGSGYLSAPGVVLSTGTQGTLTVTAVVTTDSGAVGSVTNDENAIIARMFIPAADGGTATNAGDIIKQVSTRRFKVKNSEGTGICQLETANYTLTAGKMTIKATDSDGNNYLVSKITSRRVTLVPNAAGGIIGTQFASGASALWTFGSAVANTTVTIQNG